MTGADGMRPEPGPNAGIDEIEADIDQTRRELGQTVQTLSAKLDVKGRATQKAADTKDRITEKAHDATERVRDTAQSVRQRPAVPVIAIVVTTAAVVGIIVWRRRR